MIKEIKQIGCFKHVIYKLSMKEFFRGVEFLTRGGAIVGKRNPSLYQFARDVSKLVINTNEHHVEVYKIDNEATVVFYGRTHQPMQQVICSYTSDLFNDFISNRSFTYSLQKRGESAKFYKNIEELIIAI